MFQNSGKKVLGGLPSKRASDEIIYVSCHYIYIYAILYPGTHAAPLVCA